VGGDYGGNGILNYGNKYNQENDTIIIGRVGAYCGNIFSEKNNFGLWQFIVYKYGI
jgi:type I restriction enzyme S subunit